MSDYSRHYSYRAERRRKRRRTLVIIAIILVALWALQGVIKRSVDKAKAKIDDIYEVPELQYISQQEKMEMVHSMTEDSVSTQDLTRIGKEDVHILDEPERKWYLTWEDVVDYFLVAKDIVETKLEQSSNDQ